ncbi:hypothetical protein GEMRC1_011641 [Eukaryota sp. GEM-RC1]
MFLILLYLAIFLVIWYTVLQHYFRRLVLPKRVVDSNIPFQSSSSVVQNCFNLLSTYCPVIPVNSQNISVLVNPTDFYDSIISHIRNAKHRIFISALYFGTGQLEQTIITELESALKKNPNLSVNLIFDHRRLLRGFGKSSSGRTCCVELFSGLLNSISRTAELFGVLHLKGFVFDNHVIVSGANLSDDYLSGPESGKQDRYFLFKDSPNLCHWFVSLMDIVSPFCFQSSLQRHWLSSSCCPSSTTPSLTSLITTFQTSSPSPSDTVVLPTVQAGFSRLGHESGVLQGLFSAIDSSSPSSSTQSNDDYITSLSISTPYLNFPRPLARQITKISHNPFINLFSYWSFSQGQLFLWSQGNLWICSHCLCLCHDETAEKAVFKGSCFPLR